MLPVSKRTSVLVQAAILGAVMAGLVAGCASSRKAGSRMDEPERARIERRLGEIFDAAEKKDFDRLDSYHLYGPKFTKYSGSSAVREDAVAGRKGEHDGLTAIRELRMRAEDLRIDLFGDIGIATFILDSSFKAGAGVVAKRNRGTLVFVKDAGVWKITHEHFSPMPP